MKLIGYAAAVSMLASLSQVAPAQEAETNQGVIPSPDGRYQQCMDRLEYNRLSARMTMPAISIWFGKATANGRTVPVRRFLSVDTSPPKQNGREWSLWIGWDEDLATNGKTPRLVCIQGGGQGVILLNAGAPLPARPFGRTIPKGGHWQTNPNDYAADASRTMGRRMNYWQACRVMGGLANELSRPENRQVLDCDTFGIAGLDLLLRSEGFSPRIIMRSDPSTTKMLIAYYNKASALRLVYVADSGVAEITDAADAQLAEPLFATLKAATP